MGERLGCCVPFCKRTTKAPYVEWICAKHWRMVPADLKAERRRWKRIAHKASMRGRHHSRIYARANALWERCKAMAIETAVGI